MIRRIWLIAEREFRTYATTATFWLACLVVPIALVAVAVLAGRGGGPAQVSVIAGDPALAQSAPGVILEAAAADGRKLVVVPAGGARITLHAEARGELKVAFDDAFPLSRAARLSVVRTLERDAARRATGLAPAPASAAPPASRGAPTAGSVGRFAVVMMLWLTLTGSLGMLLQAVVREGSNRALEVLLSAVRPQELVLGKVAGVGMVSTLVMGLWLGSAWVASAFMGGSRGVAGGALQAMGDPALLATAAVVYVLGFGFYGMVTVGIGALARDNAGAQNLARPMFLLLLFAFFLALFRVGGAAKGLAWLTYVPLFSPFLVLLQPPKPLELAATLALLALGAALANLWASSVVEKSFASRPSRPRRHG